MADLVKGKFKCRIDGIRNKGDNTHRYSATILEIIKKLAGSANVNVNDQVTLKIVHASDKDSDYLVGGAGTFDGDENDIQTNSGNVKINARNSQPFSIPSDFTVKDKKNGEQEMPNTDQLQKYINLLKSNYNLILTGAPGTGKTHLAKQIAMQMLFRKTDEKTLTNDEKAVLKDHYEFVQFHPSYDYTDFVEGLRPTGENENIGFKLQNGIFKNFCKKAIGVGGTDNFDEAWEKLVNDLEGNDFIDVPLLSGAGTFRVELNEYDTGLATRMYPDNEFRKGAWINGKSKYFNKDQLYNIYRGLPGVPRGGHDNYRKAIVNHMKKNPKYSLKEFKTGNPAGSDQKYIFVIDEINRGEISKIFGELFFSVDPGYRGKDGKVKTQYANMQEGETIFDSEEGQGWFYIPENVYIIGTMNDIDRSVESFDFAMRRRFVWKEVTADDSAINMKLKETIGETALNKMQALNKEITGIKELGQHYQIGAAYFLKLKDYKTTDSGYDYSKLWSLHIKPLLWEYVRALPDPNRKLEMLERAYNLEKEDKNEDE